MKLKTGIMIVLVLGIFLCVVPVNAGNLEEFKFEKIPAFSGSPVSSTGINSPDTSKLYNPIMNLDTGTSKLYNPTTNLDTGTSKLYNPIMNLDTGTSKLYNPTTNLDTGTSKLYNPIMNLDTGTSKLYNPIMNLDTLKYTTDIASQNRIMDTMGQNAQFDLVWEPVQYVEQTSTNGLLSLAYPEFDTFIGVTSMAGDIYSLSDNTFDRVGLATQMTSPPLLDTTKYETKQFGPFGVFGGQTIGTDTWQSNGITSKISDSYYTTGNSLDHFTTQQTNFNDISLSPGITASGSHLETNTFHTPLQSGVSGWVDSRASTIYPSTGYDPSTNLQTRSVNSFTQTKIDTGTSMNSFNRPLDFRTGIGSSGFSGSYGTGLGSSGFSGSYGTSRF